MKSAILNVILLVCVLSTKAQSRVGRIVNGADTQPGDVPFIIEIQYKSPQSHSCAGSLITPSWVVTAAHCLPKTTKLLFQLVAGEYNLKIKSGNEQVRNISEFFVHPNYYGSSVGFDIGVIKAESPFVLNRWVGIISLPPRNFIHRYFLQVYGWGSTDPRGEEATDILQKTYLYLIPFDDCMDIFMTLQGEIPLHESELCAGNLDGSTDSCSGDSGGPLIQSNPLTGKLELVAVVSWGSYPCNLLNHPSVNTRVSAFVDWITETIK